MGNKQQKKQRREARKKKEKRFSSFQELQEVVKVGVISKKEPNTTSVATPPRDTSAVPPATDKETVTKAGVKEYNDFFGLYAKSVRERRPFRSLGFIPGPAVVLEFREGNEVRIFAATSDVVHGIGTVPTPWMVWEKLPEKIRQAIGEWKTVVDGLGYEPSPYNLGLARELLGGHPPTKYLAMVMPRFRYRPDDPEKKFGVALITIMEGGESKGLKVKTYNPDDIPDVPADSAILKLNELKNGRGPVQKLLRTTALMETNYLGRYDRGGYRLQQNDQSQSRSRPADQPRP